MQKINIKDFTKIFSKHFIFLCEKYKFKISETQENSVKKENTIIHKLIYTNTDTKRIIEFVLIAEDYNTHMFCRIAEVYIKKVIENGLTPHYIDFVNCFTIDDIEELVKEEYKYSDTLNTLDNYINKVDYTINQMANIFNNNYWPTINEIGEIQHKRNGYVSVGKRSMPFIDVIKTELIELINYGYKIIFDETQIPPYEQDFMGPRVSYYNKAKNIRINIVFQTKDYEFYVSTNLNKNYFYGRAAIEDYIKLKNTILL